MGDRQPTRLASGFPYPPPRARTRRELNRPLSKRRRILAVGAAALVVAVATVVAYLVMARPSPSSRQVAAPSSRQVAAPPAGARPPLRLSDYVTDNAGVLSESRRAAVTSAVPGKKNDASAVHPKNRCCVTSFIEIVPRGEDA